MPAINLPRLKIQISRLMDSFDNPDLFLSGVHTLFDQYADRSLRKSAISSSFSVLPAYRVSPPVIRQLELEMGARALADPDHSLIIADRLWEDGYYETRLIAAFILGRMPPGMEGFLDRLSTWVIDSQDAAVANTLLTTSLSRIRSETPDEFLLLMAKWTHPSKRKLIPSVMIALVPLLLDKNFHNLPPVFNIVQPIIETAPVSSQQQLSNLVCALYDASPIETVFFLRRLLVQSQGLHANRNIRRIMPSLPQTLQDEIRDSVRR